MAQERLTAPSARKDYQMLTAGKQAREEIRIDESRAVQLMTFAAERVGREMRRPLDPAPDYKLLDNLDYEDIRAMVRRFFRRRDWASKPLDGYAELAAGAKLPQGLTWINGDNPEQKGYVQFGWCGYNVSDKDFEQWRSKGTWPDRASIPVCLVREAYGRIVDARFLDNPRRALGEVGLRMTHPVERAVFEYAEQVLVSLEQCPPGYVRWKDAPGPIIERSQDGHEDLVFRWKIEASDLRVDDQRQSVPKALVLYHVLSVLARFPNFFREVGAPITIRSGEV